MIETKERNMKIAHSNPDGRTKGTGRRGPAGGAALCVLVSLILVHSAVGVDVDRHLTPDNPFREIKVINKFGEWPAKEGEPYYSSKVGTWFTVWWTEEGAKTFDHWTKEDWTRVKPVDYGYYSSGDEHYLTHVLLRLKAIGIDFIALDDTNGHWNDYGLIARNMEAVYRGADRLGEDAPQVTIATGRPLREGDYREQRRELNAYYEKFVKKHPDAFFNWRGKPLVIMYLAGQSGQRMRDRRFTLRYGTGLATWQHRARDTDIFRTTGNWAWVFDLQNPGSEVMGAQPGYNKAHQGAPIDPVPRMIGGHYINQWLEAIKQNPEVIIIPSYNDHAEETGWEATVPLRPAIPEAAQDTIGEDPYLYEKITEAYLALRYGFIEGFYYREEGSNDLYRYLNGALTESEPPNPLQEPVIIVPAGYFEWHAARRTGR